MTTRPLTHVGEPPLPGETPFRRSCRHVEFGDKADLIVIQVGGLPGCDAHLKPVLLAQDKHLLNGEGLNFSGWETECERNGRSNLSMNARADRSRGRQAAFLSWRRIQATCSRNLIEQGKLGHKFWAEVISWAALLCARVGPDGRSSTPYSLDRLTPCWWQVTLVLWGRALEARHGSFRSHPELDAQTRVTHVPRPGRRHLHQRSRHRGGWVRLPAGQECR